MNNKKRLEIKQNELISLRVMAQEALLHKKELEGRTDKQSVRQYEAAAKKYQQLLYELQLQNAKLIELQKKCVIDENNRAFALFTIAFPF